VRDRSFCYTGEDDVFAVSVDTVAVSWERFAPQMLSLVRLPTRESAIHSEMIRALLRVLPFAVLIAVIAIRVRQGRFSAGSLDLRAPPRWSTAFAWWGGFLVYMLVAEALLYRAGLVELGGLHHQGLPAVVRILGMVLLAPIAEELFFRGVLLNLLQHRLGSFPLALVVQALLFTLLHNFTWRGDLMGGMYAAQSFVGAMMFAWARRSSGSLGVPMAMHATGNTLAVLEMLA